jgi:PQQ-like domain/Ankyrin repeats (3 copies)
MKTRLVFPTMPIIFLLVFGCSGMKVASRMPYAVETANRLNQSQPAPVRDLPVDYHGADIIRFVGNQSLLVGTLTFDVAGTPAYGPVILYDTADMTEKWRIPRERHYAARHQFVAFAPHLILRTAFEGRIVHSAYDHTSGRLLWTHTADARSVTAYRTASLFDLAAFYVLDEGQLQAVDAKTGAVQWQVAASVGDAAGATGQLLALDDRVVLADTGSMTAFAPQDGRRLWTLANPVSGHANVLADARGVFVYGADKAVHVDKAGRLDWQWEIPGEGIKLVAPQEKMVLIITHDARHDHDRLHCVAGAKTRWSADLPGHVMSPVLAEKRVFYLTTAPQATESGERTLVGIDARRGKRLFQRDLPIASAVMETAYVPLSDTLVRQARHLLVLRESYGITAVDTSKKKVVWTQPMPVSAKVENMNLISRVDPQFTLAVKDQYNPTYVAANLKSGQTALENQLKYQHMAQALSPVTDTAPNLGGSASATAASQQFQRDMNLAASTIVAVNALADASNAFWAAFGEAMIQKTNLAARMTAVTGIRMAEAQYQVALSGNYCVPAPTESITVVDLDTGKRADLQATLAIPNLPGRAWTVALSPDETRLAVVGIGLNNSNYRGISRGMLEVPASSLIVYQTDKLDFRDKVKAPAQPPGPATPVAPPPTTSAAPAATDASYLLTAGYPPLVAYAMQGSLQDVKKALAAGEDVNKPYAGMGLTPLMAAVYRGDAAIVKLLLDAGADIDAKSAFGKTAYDTLARVKNPAARAEIKKLLDAAAKTRQ